MGMIIRNKVDLIQFNDKVFLVAGSNTLNKFIIILFIWIGDLLLYI